MKFSSLLIICNFIFNPILLCAANETDSTFDKAFAKAAPQKERMLFCFKSSAIKFATQTCESAETIVDAAYGDCRAAEDEYVLSLLKNIPFMKNESIRKGVANGKIGLRQPLLAIILNSRMNSQRCAKNLN